MQDEVERIAASLTEAQRLCVARLSGEAQLPGLATFNANAAFNMVRIGVTELGFNRRLMRDTFQLTRLGVHVRAHLEKQHARA